MTPAKTLRAARKLIQEERNWGQGVYKRQLRTSRLRQLFRGLEYQYCAVGALYEMGRVSELSFSRSLLDKAAYHFGAVDAVHLNDSKDHARVLRMFDMAIEMAEAHEA